MLSHNGRHAVTAATFFMIAAINLAADSSTDPNVEIRFQKNANDVEGIVVTTRLKTTLERAYRALTDPNCGPKLFSNVQAIVPDADADGIWDYQMASPLGAKHVRCKVRFSPHKRTVSWERIGGDLKVFEGHWKLWNDPLRPGLVVAEYTNYIEPGGIANLFFTRARRRKMAVSMVPKLRQLVGDTSGYGTSI